MQGKRSANQRIEAFWSKLRQGGGGWWINYFKDLKDCGIFNDSDPLHGECLKVCFIHVLRKELRLVTDLWNSHTILTRKGFDVQGGKPDVMFLTPQLYATCDYLIQACSELYAENCRDYSVEMEEIADLVFLLGRNQKNEEESIRLFCSITSYIDSTF